MLLPLSLLSFTLVLIESALGAADDVTLFIHNNNPDIGWAASIINACNNSTTYQLACTSAPANAGCSPSTFTLTANSATYIATTPAIYAETSALIAEACALQLNPTASTSFASCTATVAENQYGNSITTTTSYNISGATAYYTYTVAVTAGAQKLDDASQPCGVSPATGLAGRAWGGERGGSGSSLAVVLVGVGLGVGIGVLGLL